MRVMHKGLRKLMRVMHFSDEGDARKILARRYTVTWVITHHAYSAIGNLQWLEGLANMIS